MGVAVRGLQRRRGGDSNRPSAANPNAATKHRQQPQRAQNQRIERRYFGQRRHHPQARKGIGRNMDEPVFGLFFDGADCGHPEQSETRNEPQHKGLHIRNTLGQAEIRAGGDEPDDDKPVLHGCCQRQFQNVQHRRPARLHPAIRTRNRRNPRPFGSRTFNHSLQKIICQ